MAIANQKENREMTNADLEAIVEKYRQARPEESLEIESALRNERMRFASACLETSAGELANRFAGDEGKRFRLLRQTGLQDIPGNTAENQLASTILKNWQTTGSPLPGPVMAGMLMLKPHELPLPKSLSDIADWLVFDYADFLLTSPGVFNTIGEADRYADYFAFAIDLFHRALITEGGFPKPWELSNLFLQKANFIQFYFNEKQLGRIFRKRAEILEFWGLAQKAPLAHLFPLPKRAGRKIKIGILSAHFSPQTETFLMLSYFDKLPRDTFSITLYSLRKTNHPLENHCVSRVDRFVLLDGDNYHLKAERIRADELDLLLIGTNTSAVTNPIVILALFRLARIHLIVENSPVSSGFTHTDFYLSSDFNEPDSDAQKNYSERLYKVPGMLNYYAYHFDTDPCTVKLDRQQLGIPEDAVAYFSGANFFKILPELSKLWAGIFSRVPNSCLVLLPFNPNWTNRYLSRPFIDRLRADMNQAGVDFNRIRILNRLPTRADVHAVMALCDIYLDSFPYAGACSMIDPLTVGLPIVCRAGKTMRGNLAAAMLKGAELTDLISRDSVQYVENAVALGRDKNLRDRVRTTIGNTLSRYNPFFDTGACGAKIASAFADMVDMSFHADMRLLGRTPDVLKQMIRRLIGKLDDSRNMYMGNLVSGEPVRLLISPYFKSLEDGNTKRSLADAGPVDDSLAMAFLSAGWEIDFAGIDRAVYSRIENVAKQLSGAFRFSKAASIKEYLQCCLNKDVVRTGPGGPGLTDLVPADSETGAPRLAISEFDSSFSRISQKEVAAEIAEMSARGFDFVVFYEQTGEKRRLVEMSVDTPGRIIGDMGRLFYYQRSDVVFPVMLIRLLNSFLPATERVDGTL